MQKKLKYVVFGTKWGHFGLLGDGSALYRTQLPSVKIEDVSARLTEDIPIAEFDKNYLKDLQQQIKVYFEGNPVDFSRNIRIESGKTSVFCKKVLNACRKISFGQIMTYKELAEKTGRANAARAIGNCLAKNPLPLIIPCHRVIRSDGKTGGFSAIGGAAMKKKLLEHEKLLKK